MAAQTATEGRYLGGRPLYGYRLADAGPHPNPGKAASGKRLSRLVPDKARIYAELGLRLTYQPGRKTVVAEATGPATGDANATPGEASVERFAATCGCR